ncbi:MAG: hydroxyacid dehydrogenase [Chthoniobacteraceae bacterium]
MAGLTDLYPELVDLENFERHARSLCDLEVIFSTWKMPRLRPEHLCRLPNLKAVFYAAGTVKAFARPFLERGILVVSAWHANAVPVAEFTLGQILLSMKGYFRNAREYSEPGYWELGRFLGAGNYGETVALLGAGAIGQKVIELLRPFHHRVIVFDPLLSESRAEELGVEKVSLQAAFREGYVVSNHLANIPETQELLNEELFASMRADATFLNTGRGATVDEAGLIQVFASRPDLTALLDVTWPEPPVQGSPLYGLPNIHLSSHLAGSSNDETVRMADLCIEEFLAWKAKKPLRYAVTLEMLNRMT